MMDGIDIRALRLEEMRIPIDWAAREGWNPGLHDAEPFHTADPQGFLAAFVDGEPAACISVVRSGQDFGFLGFYICRPDMRGKGIGWRSGRPASRISPAAASGWTGSSRSRTIIGNRVSRSLIATCAGKAR